MADPRKAERPGARQVRWDLRFECTECGDCCTNRGDYAYVYVNREEVRQLAAHLELTTQAFRRRYTFRDEDGWTQLQVRDRACVFLDAESRRCTVYAARPVQCRTFPFWPGFVRKGRWTGDVRRLCEGIGRGKRHSRAQAEARMAEFSEAEAQD
jgi:Fe-S-cluster containining protein